MILGRHAYEKIYRLEMWLKIRGLNERHAYEKIATEPATVEIEIENLITEDYDQVYWDEDKDPEGLGLPITM